MSFDEYTAAIDKLARKYDAASDGKPYCDPEAWREYYEDGASPEEAWASEMSYWEP